jgi:leucyl aminopeptidase
MNLDVSFAPPLASKVDLLVLPCFEEELRRGAKGGTGALLQSADRRLGGQLFQVATDEGFKGAFESTLLLHTGGKLPFTRLLLLGLGKRARYRTELLRQSTAQAIRLAGRVSAQKLAMRLPGAAPGTDEVEAAAEGAELGAYRFDRYRTEKKRRRPEVQRLTLLAASAAQARVGARQLPLAKEIAASVNWARDLVNEPAGTLTPRRLAAEAVAMARAHGLRSEVRGPAEIRRLGMGMLLGVSQGSAEEPRLIHVWYQPRGAAAKRPPLAIVGKAITFDSGGLSLKTNEGMMDMKTDMAGSAAALGAMRAIASLRPPFPVHAFMGACENMPGGKAYKLGDVLTSRSGKTVEITNTDAEGRLALGDVLHWANEWKPSALVDLATLTGACVVALGHWTVGAFSPDDELASEVLTAAHSAGEDFWRLPMTEWVKDTLKSDIADLRNTGERWGGAIAAAHFLHEFVGETPWIHLDIAGPSFSHKERGYIPKGGTGVGVRTLVELVRNRS